MNVYRISRRKWAENLRGSGIPARWNRQHAKMIYTSSSIALALLEILVHISRDQIPEDYVWVQAEIPETLKTVVIEEIPPDPAGIGTEWLYGATSAVLSVPSVIVPEKNYLLNPDHTDFAARAIS